MNAVEKVPSETTAWGVGEAYFRGRQNMRNTKICYGIIFLGAGGGVVVVVEGRIPSFSQKATF